MEILTKISIGEALDKLSILEIKKTEIIDIEKIKNIEHEIKCISPSLEQFISKHKIYYDCLKIINKIIWDGMENTKNTENTNYLKNCMNVFYNNDARFRCKKILNKLSFSEIVEEKSYGKDIIYLIGTDKMCEDIISTYTNYLSFYFDNVIYSNNLMENFENFQINKNQEDSKYSHLYSNNVLLKKIGEITHSENLNYVNRGALGDLIHVLYVIRTIYLTTGKKGNLYINISAGSEFRHGEETYKDIKNFIEYQEYINEFNIYRGNEKIDINLDEWRSSNFLFKTDWLKLLSSFYNIPLINMSWTRYTTNEKYSDCIVINRSFYRHINNFPWENIVTKNKCVFVSFNMKDYEVFPYKNNVELINVTNFHEMAQIINSCKFFIGNQSMPLALAYSLNKPCLGELYGPESIFYSGLENYNENYNWISADSSYLDDNLLNKYNINI